jgi:hypothetical protein
MGFRSKKQRDRVMADRRDGQTKPTRVPLPRAAKSVDLTSELHRMEFADEAVRIAGKHLKAVSVRELRQDHSANISGSIARDLVEAGFPMETAIAVGVQAVRCAAISDRLATWKAVAGEVATREFANNAEMDGYQDALEYLRFQLDAGKSVQSAIRSDGLRRRHGRLFAPSQEYADQWHHGAEAACREVAKAYREAGQ